GTVAPPNWKSVASTPSNATRVGVQPFVTTDVLVVPRVKDRNAFQQPPKTLLPAGQPPVSGVDGRTLSIDAVRLNAGNNCGTNGANAVEMLFVGGCGPENVPLSASMLGTDAPVLSVTPSSPCM